MKSPIISSLWLVVLASVSLVTRASAVVNMVYVPIGNPGNAADTYSPPLYGAVGYTYNIGKYEVTNSQYTAFLNAVDPGGANANGIYNSLMGRDIHGGIAYNSGGFSGSKYIVRTNMGNKPVNFVSWYDSARFANWLNNGQGAGSTETGAYTLNGNTGIPTRNVGATVWLPSEDEWYKAAYYDPNKGGAGGGGYRLYPTPGDAVPTIADANFNSSGPTDVGSFSSDPSSYGTFDQGGNVYEWNDSVISGSLRGRRGGGWSSFGELTLTSPYSLSSAPTYENAGVGFRVASIPEPTSLILTMFASGGLLIRRKR